MSTGQPIAGKWMDDPIVPGIIRWHNGTTFTGLAGGMNEILMFLQNTKGNRGIVEPVRDGLSMIKEPSVADLEILSEKLASLNGAFPNIGTEQHKELWTVPIKYGMAIGWHPWPEEPEYLVYWYGENGSNLFLKERVEETGYEMPDRVAAYIAQREAQAASSSNEVSPTEETPSGPVSRVPAPDNPDETCWIIDPEDSKALIFWNGDEWSKRKVIKDVISEQLESLGLEMPSAWDIDYSHARRDWAILQVLIEMRQGPAWVRDPESDFYDLKVRWWDGEQYTDGVGADGPGWYDAPKDKSKFQWWNGGAWEEKFLDKEELQMEADQKEASRNAKKAFALSLVAAAYDGYTGGSTASQRLASKQAALAADRREWEKGWEDKRQAKRDEATRQQEKFYRKANERRRW